MFIFKKHPYGYLYIKKLLEKLYSQLGIRPNCATRIQPPSSRKGGRGEGRGKAAMGTEWISEKRRERRRCWCWWEGGEKIATNCFHGNYCSSSSSSSSSFLPPTTSKNKNSLFFFLTSPKKENRVATWSKLGLA